MINHKLNKINIIGILTYSYFLCKIFYFKQNNKLFLNLLYYNYYYFIVLINF